MPVFVSVMVTLAFPTAAPDESVTAPSKVAFTAWPLSGTEHARSTNTTAAAISPNRTWLPLGAASHPEFSLLGFRGFTPNKDMLKRLLMTLPHSAQKLAFLKEPPMELVPNHNRVSRLLSSEKFNECNPFDRPFCPPRRPRLTARKRSRALAYSFPMGSPRSEEQSTQVTPCFVSAAIPPPA